MRFGIFWRQLRYDLTKVGDSINAAALLHNCIVNKREEENEVVGTEFFKDSQEKQCINLTTIIIILPIALQDLLFL